MMILPANKYLRVIKGTTFNYTFTLKNSQGPINMAGWHAQWVITWSNGSTTLTDGLAGSGVFFGGYNGNTASGLVSLIMVAADTTAIPWTSATYTFRLTDPLMNVYQLLEGGMGIIS